MKIIFIRHGKTKGNIEKRYIGRTDESLCSEGIEEIKKIKNIYADIVVSSPMKRCIETANILFGKIDIICDGLKECDFGNFENKNYSELKSNKQYIKWLESGGKLPFPNGESHKAFCKRCNKSFAQIVDNYINNNSEKIIAFVIHGGSIMAICEHFAKPYKSFYQRQLPNGGILYFNTKYNNKNLILYETK